MDTESYTSAPSTAVSLKTKSQALFLVFEANWTSTAHVYEAKLFQLVLLRLPCPLGKEFLHSAHPKLRQGSGLAEGCSEPGESRLTLE